ncbi:orotidine-5'-phosphate decarboxylase [Melioribacter sp. OK-6-Me]|uniref:orotidine-5'-phosphate decarboxylase n=1 Tax=unclassified Melioribacter TaxID=2627329 RepID=UPI003ED9FC51
MTAQEKLYNKINSGLHVCVGLDTDLSKIPEYFKKEPNPILAFNKTVIENTYEYAAAYKINFAFYEKDGLEGVRNLLETIKLIPEDILIIADAKRGDIGNTSHFYAESIFNYFKCDAITLHPYMGFDSLQPFFEFENKLNFVLALTSNPGSEDFEKLKLADGRFLFNVVIEKLNKWNIRNNIGLVFGATNPLELRNAIDSFDNMPVLLPGVGVQGGSYEEVVSIFRNKGKRNFIVNISRGLLYCDQTDKFPETLREKIISYINL